MMKIKAVGFDVAKQQLMTQSSIADSANPVKMQTHGGGVRHVGCCQWGKRSDQ